MKEPCKRDVSGRTSFGRRRTDQVSLVKPALTAIAFLVGFLPVIAAANPVNPGGEARGMVGVALTGIALSVEVALSAALLVLICRVEHRVRLVAGLLGLNLLSYAIFVDFLFPRFPHLVLIELMIWLLEAGGMMLLVRWAGGSPLKAWQALVISLVGNLASYLIGEAMWSYEEPPMDELTDSGILGIWVGENDS